MTDEPYNGWTNRETWATALHIDNDEGLHTQRNKLCHKSLGDAIATEYLSMEQVAQRRLADSLENWVQEMSEEIYFPTPNTPYEPDFNPQTRSLLGMFNDIGSLWRVNWDEIASNWLEDFEDAA